MNPTLESALRKSQHYSGRTWCGHLRPQEILELRDLGVGYNYKSKIVEIAIDWKRTGKCNPLWFYFDPNDEFLDMRKKWKS